jgi:hypothetical protein
MLLHYCCFIRFFPTLVFPCDTIGCDPAGCPHTAPHDKNKRLLLYRSWNCSSVPDTSPLLSEWAATNPEKIVNYSIVPRGLHLDLYQAASDPVDQDLLQELCIRWRLDVLAFPLDLDMEFILRPPSRAINAPFGRSVCVFSKTPSIQQQPMLCTAFRPAVVSTVFRRRVRQRLRPVSAVVLIRSLDHAVIKSSSEDFLVNLAA